MAKFAWKKGASEQAHTPLPETLPLAKNENTHQLVDDMMPMKEEPSFVKHYMQTRKSRKPLGPRTWRTRKDPLEGVWDEVKLRLQLSPHCTAKSLLVELIQKYPNQLGLHHLRTLQRRIMEWKRTEWAYPVPETGQHTIDGRSKQFLSLAETAMH